MALPSASPVTIAYLGQHRYKPPGRFPGGSTLNVNAVDFGAAYLAQNQDPTKAASAIPGASALTTNLLRPYRGLGIIAQQETSFWDTYHSLQFTLNRRYRNSFAFGVNYTRGLSFKGNTGLQLRLQHNPDGSYSIRPDQQ